MQALLAERLKLKVHRETREIPKYELVMAKGGPKLQAAIPGACIARVSGHPPEPPCSRPVRPTHVPGTVGIGLGFDMHGVTIGSLCAFLSRSLGAEVIDQTGISGVFDLRLDLPLDDSAAAPRTQNMSDRVVDLKGAFADKQRASEGPSHSCAAEATGTRP